MTIVQSPDVAGATLKMSNPSLAERKKQVMELVALGLQSKEIAAILGLSDHTIKAYTSWLLSDYSVENRTALSLLYWNKRNEETLQRLNEAWVQATQSPELGETVFKNFMESEKQRGTRT
jgi:DNA-binding CsgD family transcriptional regulator